MDAIVNVFISPRDGRLLPEHALGGRYLDSWQRNISSQSAEVNLSKSSGRADVAPPFWTWFIENPRPSGT